MAAAFVGPCPRGTIIVVLAGYCRSALQNVVRLLILFRVKPTIDGPKELRTGTRRTTTSVVVPRHVYGPLHICFL